ncbi:tetraacyldisaccharide 4'-kinase [Planctomycetes bacterium K23_9]|uniref:Tetraacyldisaccharide 4'-kinase n=1 Tax=Stieleria marina TaxID=1930275 RepID=A0A517NQT7_9BACT|nr:Tetraacyldisaccharide 4'-kinase [Planctomycetes bacterium K23_9]
MVFDFRPVLNGERRDPLAIMTRLVLRFASVPYGWGVQWRNRQFESGQRETVRCGVPVISVGNLTTGGTGKTPIVCFLAKQLRDRGVRVAIVSRGFGRGEADENDEAMELHARLPDVPHVQDPDRVEAARIAVEELEAEVILMDDGFQHRRLHRDKNIVVIDATCPFGYGHLLPRGLLREPIGNVTRADLVLISRCDNVDSEALANIESQVHRVHPEVPIVRSNHVAKTLLQYPSDQQSIDSLAEENVAALCAIGNPDAFMHTIRDCGAVIVQSKALPDHDRYSPETMAEVREWIQTMGDSIDQVVCTHKDLVKICSDRIGGKPLGAIAIDLELVGDESPLEILINDTLSQSQLD